MMVNRIMKDEKKSLAYQILYSAVKKIQQKTETNHRVTPAIGAERAD